MKSFPNAWLTYLSGLKTWSISRIEGYNLTLKSFKIWPKTTIRISAPYIRTLLKTLCLGSYGWIMDHFDPVVNQVISHAILLEQVAGVQPTPKSLPLLCSTWHSNEGVLFAFPIIIYGGCQWYNYQTLQTPLILHKHHHPYIARNSSDLPTLPTNSHLAPTLSPPSKKAQHCTQCCMWTIPPYSPGNLGKLVDCNTKALKQHGWDALFQLQQPHSLDLNLQYTPCPSAQYLACLAFFWGSCIISPNMDPPTVGPGLWERSHPSFSN